MNLFWWGIDRVCVFVEAAWFLHVSCIVFGCGAFASEGSHHALMLIKYPEVLLDVPSPRPHQCILDVHGPCQVESEYEMAERVRLRKQAAREQDNDRTGASAGLGERLLQGWAMLSTPCPTRGCNSPLMRDRNGSVSCVSCSNTATNKSEAVQAAEEVVEDDQKGEADGDREMLDDDGVRIYTKRRVAELTMSRAAGTARRAAMVKVGAGGTAEVVEHARITANALDTVYKAIDMSERRLRCCTGEGVMAVDVEESSQQAELLAKLAIAARALGDLRK